MEGFANQSTKSFTSSTSSLKPSWIESNINKLECSKYVPLTSEKCKCGRDRDKHEYIIQSEDITDTRWNSSTHTYQCPTDAFGTLEFQGGPHPLKARYVRIHFKTYPTDLLHLLLYEWKMKVPNLVISIIGGLVNFDLQPKLKDLFKNGLIKAAKTTGAWILTSGIDTGVAKHVGEAIKDEVHAKGSNIVALGLSPWGMVQNRRHLIGKEKTCPYYSISNKNQTQAALNKYHNYFLLADNGTVDKFGAEKILRRNLERYLASQSIRSKCHNRSGTRNKVPVVAVLMEGGIQAFRVVFELVTDECPVPVVVCEGSGRAADLLAFMHRHADEEGELPSEMREKLMKTIGKVFFLKKKEVDILYKEMKLCLKRRDLITIYRVDEDCPDIDVAILTALLQCSKLSKADQLSLTVAWNRPDIAKSQLFDSEIDWLPQTLESAMTDSLLNDRLDFIKLLLQNGVNIHRYLSNVTLESLYNCCATNGDFTFNSILRNALNLKKQPLQLRHVGYMIELLAGSGFQHHFCHQLKMKQTLIKESIEIQDTISSSDILKFMTEPYEKTRELLFYFRYPYTELQQWALLTRRYDMAMYMVMSGEEAIAKSLFSVRILRGLKKLIDMDNAYEYFEEIKEWETKFEQLAVNLQDHCYKHNPEETRRLLCYELHQFSNHTCISLAYLCQSKPFLSHVCTQYILNDLWYGGLREGKFVGVKVLLILCGLLMIFPIFPLSLIILKWNRILEFKSKQELALQPQTLEEYLNDSDSSSDSSSSDSSSEDNADKIKIDVSGYDLNKELEISMPPIENTSQNNITCQKENLFNKEMAKSDTALNLNYTNFSDTSAENKPKEEKVFRVFLEEPKKEAAKGDSLALKKLSLGTTPNFQQMHYVNRGMPRRNSNGSFTQWYNNRFQNRATDRHLFENYIEGMPDYTNITPATPLSWKKKIHEFFYAPITKFYLNVIAYVMFLFLLIDFSVGKVEISKIKWIEIYVYLYIISNFLDHFRKLSVIKVANTLQKVKIHFEFFWNIYDLCLSLLCLTGIFLRIYAWYQYKKLSVLSITNILSGVSNGSVTMTSATATSPAVGNVNEIFLWARNLLILSSGGWIIKSLELMQNWRLFGAYIEMIRSMSQQITPPILILGIIMTAFGTIRQGLMYMGDDHLGIGDILKKIYLKPYFMLYGEVYAGEIDPDNFPLETRFAPLVWIVPMMMVLFMLGAVVIILSLIIAGITDIYGKVKESSVKVYMYLRYPMIIEYESRPFVPPPFLLLLWLYRIIRQLYKRLKLCCYACKRSENVPEKKKEEHSAGLKLFLSTDEIETLHDFEEESVEDYYRQLKNSEALKIENIIKKSMKSNGLIQYQLQVFHSNLHSLRINHQSQNNKLNAIASALSNYNTDNSRQFQKCYSLQEHEEETEEENMNHKLSSCIDSADQDDQNKISSTPYTNQSGKRKLLNNWSGECMGKYGNSQMDLYDELNVSDWKSKEETPPISPSTSLLSLRMKSKKSNRHLKSKNRKAKKGNHKVQIKEENLRHAEKMEREQMTSVIVQRLRQLSYRQDESSPEEVMQVVKEIEASNINEVNEVNSGSPVSSEMKDIMQKNKEEIVAPVTFHVEYND